MEWRRCTDQNRVREWVLERVPHPEQLGPLVGLGYEVEGEMVAGFILENFNPAYRSVELHLRLERPAKGNGAFYRGLFADFASYVLGQLGCQRVSAYVPRENLRLARILKLCGFVQEGCLRRAFGVDDALVYGLLAEQAPAWLFTPARGARTMPPSRVVDHPFQPETKGENIA